jgi:hypothetical protein
MNEQVVYIRKLQFKNGTYFIQHTQYNTPPNPHSQMNLRMKDSWKECGAPRVEILKTVPQTKRMVEAHKIIAQHMIDPNCLNEYSIYDLEERKNIRTYIKNGELPYGFLWEENPEKYNWLNQIIGDSTYDDWIPLCDGAHHLIGYFPNYHEMWEWQNSDDCAEYDEAMAAYGIETTAPYDEWKAWSNSGEEPIPAIPINH